MLLSVTLKQLVDRTVYDLMGPDDLGARVVLSSAIAESGSTLQLVISPADGVAKVAVSDVIELEDELVLVTAESLTPGEYTIARGYYGTTPVAHALGTVGFVNPTHARKRIAEAIRRAFPRMEALGVPYLASTTLANPNGDLLLELPEDCREVLRVSVTESDPVSDVELGTWEFVQQGTSPMLKITERYSTLTELEVTYRAAYRWSTYPSDPVATSSIQIPEGSEDLPCLYAAAWLMSGREMARMEIDRADEYARTTPWAQGSSGAIVRAKWQEFYRALDEARRLAQVPARLHVLPRTRN